MPDISVFYSRSNKHSKFLWASCIMTILLSWSATAPLIVLWMPAQKCFSALRSWIRESWFTTDVDRPSIVMNRPSHSWHVDLIAHVIEMQVYYRFNSNVARHDWSLSMIHYFTFIVKEKISSTTPGGCLVRAANGHRDGRFGYSNAVLGYIYYH